MGFITFDNYLKASFKANDHKDNYDSFAEYVKVNTKGLNIFEPWLQEIKGTPLSTVQAQSIAKTYLKYSKSTPSNIPRVLAALQRNYDLTLPAVEGILTADYWIKRGKVEEPGVNLSVGSPL